MCQEYKLLWPSCVLAVSFSLWLYISDEEIPDEFFEVKESDIRKMWQDLQRQT